MWVGLGGWYGNNPFAQTGIGIYCRVNLNDGTAEAVYNAWREYISGVFGTMKPPEEHPLDWPKDQFPVRPGDKIIADVVYENGQSMVRLDNVDSGTGRPRWQKPAEDRRQIPRVVSTKLGPVAIPTNGVSVEVIVEAGRPAPVFDHVVFRNPRARMSWYLPGYGYVPSQSFPLSFHSPGPYGSSEKSTSQAHYPTVFNADNEFAVFQTFSKYNPFPPVSYPGDINGVRPAG